MSGFIDYSKRGTTPEVAAQHSEDPFQDGQAADQYDSHHLGRVPHPDEGRIEHPHTAAGDADHHLREDHAETRPYFDPAEAGVEEEPPHPSPFHDQGVGQFGEFTTGTRIKTEIMQLISFGATLTGLIVVVICAYARYFNPFKLRYNKARADREYERRITGERLSSRVEYYAEYWGYKCDELEIVTQGGWILKTHRLSDPRRPGPTGYPVVLQHGILCNSSHFVMNEERSMAFWLVDQGFDVWLTNIRAGFGAGHTKYSRSDPRFWAWGIKDLAYDLQDVVEFISGATGYPKIAYVGHSQGSGSMYLALSPSIVPELGNKLSCFCALGPSVYAGPVLRMFPFSLIRMFTWREVWSLAFGTRTFIPAINIFQKYTPSFWFGHLGYVVFSYLFKTHDHNWVNRQKPKIFRSVPVPTSSELLYWYMKEFSYRGCIFDPRITQPWFPSTFPPHSIWYGNIDLLVLGKPLVERIQRFEKNVRMIHAVELEGYEHLDMIFGVDAYRTIFPGILDTIVSTMDGAVRPEMEEHH
ncbi:hypothetical protein CF326_g6637 [Tilletia indica]|nr:hypothetical protein CF326_g6637 [Tilletia indica]